MMDYIDTVSSNLDSFLMLGKYAFLAIRIVDTANFAARGYNFEWLLSYPEEDLSESPWFRKHYDTVAGYLFPGAPELEESPSARKSDIIFKNRIFRKIGNNLLFTRFYNWEMKRYLKGKMFGDENALEHMKRVYGGKRKVEVIL